MNASSGGVGDHLGGKRWRVVQNLHFPQDSWNSIVRKHGELGYVIKAAKTCSLQPRQNLP